jgi:hypothetical protein
MRRGAHVGLHDKLALTTALVVVGEDATPGTT